MKQYMYHCTACKSSEVISVGPLFLGVKPCQKCGGRMRMVSSGLTKEQWDALTETEQAKVYDVLSEHRCENKRWGVLLLIGLCALLWLVTTIAPVLATFEADPAILLACAVAYLLVHDYDHAVKFRKCGEAVLHKVKAMAAAEAAESAEA